MPELPEVETIVRCLALRICGLKISRTELLFPPILKNTDKAYWEQIKGKKIKKIRRRAKMILIDCETDLTLIFHLKMTGQLLFCSHRLAPDKHTHLIIRFSGHNWQLQFRDVRKFGFVMCLPAEKMAEARELKDLGPEPLELDFGSFFKLIASRTGRIKSLLLNQKFIAGIGNIYADEILHRAKIHPLTSVPALKKEDIKRLWRAMKSVLGQAIALKGSSVRDFKDADGEAGSFQDYHRVYGRQRLPCRRCGNKVERIRVGGRSSYYCPSCQKMLATHT